MKFGIVVFPGSNCDADMLHALRDDLKQEVELLWHKDNDISSYTTDDCIVLPGGFSYGDYLRCGALAKFSPMMEQVIAFANKGGKVFGVCNGFQILCESGLLPGTLLLNDHQNFNCHNVYLKNANGNHLMNTAESVLKIPIAHGEGRYYADNETLKELEDNKQILFYYSDQEGNISEEHNPNGSSKNIAGICNKGKNVYGMMPHPERASNDLLGNKDGISILKSLI